MSKTLRIFLRHKSDVAWEIASDWDDTVWVLALGAYPLPKNWVQA